MSRGNSVLAELFKKRVSKVHVQSSSFGGLRGCWQTSAVCSFTVASDDIFFAVN